MDHILRLHEFFVEGKNQQKSHVLLHITEPASEEEKQKGYFFAVCEINNGEAKQIVKLQEIIDQIENEYYEAPASHEATNLFENTLSKVNPTGFSLLRDAITLNCLVGVIRNTEITFSFYGQPVMALFYKNKHGLYQKLNLIESNPSDGDETLFSQVVQGKISPEDFLFVGTPHILDYFNLERLEKIITTRPARQSSEHLERVLSELKNGFSFGGLIITLFAGNQLASAQATAKSNLPKGGSAKSLNTFFDTEKQTANILSPSVMPKLNSRLKDIFSGSNSNKNMTAAVTPAEQSAEISSSHLHPHRTEKAKRADIDYRSAIVTAIRGLKTAGLFLGKAIVWLAVFIWEMLTRLVNFLGLLFLVITNIQNRRQIILDNWRRGWRGYTANLKQLPLTTRILLFASIAIAIIFIFSIIYIRHQQTTAAARQIFTSALNQIKIQKDAAESALIYNDETTALASIQIAKNQLNGLDCKNKNNAKDCIDMAAQLEQLSVKLRKIITVAPQILFDWNNLTGATELGGLVKLGTKIIAYSANTSTLLIYDALTKENKILIPALPNIAGFTAAASPKENDYALLVYNKNALAMFDPKDNSLRNADISYPVTNADIKSVTVYNRRLYALDTANNSIYRHDPIKSGFARGVDWLKDKNTDIKNGLDITIDGDLFVQKSDGNIVKFTGGVVQPFTVQGLDPLLTAANEIWTYTDLNYLYILDTAGKRLIILNKDGRIKNQLMAPELDDPTGMVVDEPNNRAYILNKNKLYQINLK